MSKEKLNRTWPASTHELQDTAAITHSGLGEMVRAVQSLKDFVATFRAWANTPEASAQKTLDNMSELPALVGRLDQNND